MTTSPDDECAFRLARRGRALNPNFHPEEHLYRRCPLTERRQDYPDRLFPDQIKFYPNWSVNRAEYSHPTDVLYPDCRHLGVAAFHVQDIPPQTVSDGDVLYHWDVQHVPEEENYAHSEVWTHKKGEHITTPKLPEGIKKYFRTILSERARIIHPPAVDLTLGLTDR